MNINLVEKDREKLNKLEPNGKKEVGSSSDKEEESFDVVLTKLNDVNVSQKAKKEQDIDDANAELKVISENAKKIVDAKESDIASLQDKFDKSYDDLYSALKDENPDLASELYSLNFKTEVKQNQLEKIDVKIMDLQESLYNGQISSVANDNTLSIYKEMLSNLNKFDVDGLSENKKAELKKKKEDLNSVIENFKSKMDDSKTVDTEKITSEIFALEKQKKELTSEIKGLKDDVVNLQSKIVNENPEMAEKTKEFVSLNSKLLSTKTEKMEDVKTKHMDVLNDKISAQLDLSNIKAVEIARNYEFFDTELPERFAKKLDSELGVGFCSKVSDICKKYGLSEKDLIGLMYSESRLKPNIKNSIGAVGLIQFIPSTAKNVLHTTTSHLASLSAVEQLNYVDKYLATCLKEGGKYSAGELYTAVYMPANVGKEVVASPSIGGYYGNEGLDLNKDGKTTKTELAQKVHTKYEEALKAYGC